jgi:hypothetical protein
MATGAAVEPALHRYRLHGEGNAQASSGQGMHTSLRPT